MSRLLFTLFPLLFGCTVRESATPEYHRNDGRYRIYVETPSKGKAVMRFREYVGDSIAKVHMVELTECVVFSPETWRCDILDFSRISVDAGALTETFRDDKSKQIYTRVRP